MVKRPRKRNPVKYLKKAKVEVHHLQKPRHPVTLEEFLPSWFHTKISHEGIEASCCNVDNGEEKNDVLPLAPSLEKLIESTPQEVNTCEEKVTFTNDDLLLGDTLLNRSLYLIGYMSDEKVNRILVDGGSSVNILPIRTGKELGIPMNKLSESRVMIQGFNQGGQRAIGAIRLEITIEDMQSSAWLHVIDAKTSYNVLLGRPWIHDNKGEVEKKIVADDEPFTEAESHFADAKFYLKNRIVKEIKADGGMKSKNDEPITKRVEVTIGKAKVVTEEVHANVNKSHKGGIASYGKKVSQVLQYVPKRKKDEGESSTLQTKTLKELTLPVKRIEVVKLSSKPLAGFVTQNHWQNVVLSTKRTGEGFDPNAYKLFAKAGYNPDEPSKLGKLPSEVATRQPREGLGYKQLSPVRISIRRASNNYITVEDESAASSRPSIFDRLGKSPVRTSMFERLGPLKKGNKFRRNFQGIRTPALPKIQEISKDFQSLEHDEDEESVGSSYHVTVQVENGVPSSIEDNAELEDISLCYHISFNNGDPQEDEDAKYAPPELEEGVKTTVDALKEVNLGTDEEPRPTYISALLKVDEESTYIEILKEFWDVFAWSYKEMPGLDPKVAVHHLAVKNGARSVKQTQRRFRSDLVPLIETEVNKLIEAGFIHEVKYPTWVSSIVPVRKKNGKIRVCVDFRDLNNACPKDEFPLPIPELMIDATTGYEAMSFMDGSSGYNQICMAPKDEDLTAFRTPKGIYCYNVIPFGLKNTGATYQRAMQNIFDDLLHKNVEFYVDDLVVKSREKGDHLKDLKMPPVLAAPIPGKPLILYIAAQERSVGALLAQENSEGKENSLYYLSRMMTSNELNYSPIEKLCLALVFSIQKLKHYFQAHTVRLVSKHVPRKENKKADALAALASSLTLFDHVQVTVCQKWVVPPPNEAEGEENELKHLVAVSEVEKEEWRQPIIDYLCYGILPENPRRRTEIRRRKFTPKWDGPYIVQESYSSGEYKLVDADGMRIDPINGKFLKKYYP
ncbi:uncharacterized protein [Nicotiana sylvestris]|uniref:uncharacterized protein n=1 Tax=Nicotiana sylvestris TaxID=4096 RepID=UPI00388CE882